jgi:hypothetical protein
LEASLLPGTHFLSVLLSVGNSSLDLLPLKFKKMKTPFFPIALFFLLSGCAASVQLSSKKDMDYNRQLQAVYIQAEPTNDWDAALFETVISGLKAELSARGVQVREDYLDDSTNLVNGTAFRPDAILWLEKKLVDQRKGSIPVLAPGGFYSPTVTTDRLIIRLQDASSLKDVWLGGVSVVNDERRYIARKVVQQFEMDSLVSRLAK